MRSAAPVLAFALALAACGGKHVASPRPAVPALFASIPADTPYVVASFEAIPPEVFAMYRDVLGDTLRTELEHPDGEDEASSAGRQAFVRLSTAFLAELDGKWNAAGMESLGLSATPRFALYGLGLLPVLRLEIRDGGALLATIERIAQRAQAPLPPPETRGGRRFWRIDDGDRQVIVAITGDQLVAAYGPRGELDAALPLVLGIEQPARNMADGAELAAARAKHGLGGQAIGIVDARRLWAQVLAAGHPSPACAAEIDRLAARAPRLVAGYGITGPRHDVSAVLEVAPDLARELRSLEIELPGYAQALADQPLMLLAGGADLPRGQALLHAGAERVQRAAAACGSASGMEQAARRAAELAAPLPSPVAELRGGLVDLMSASLGDGPLPTALDGFAVMTSPAAKQLFELGRGAISALLPVDFEADGKLHRLPLDRLPIELPYQMFAGASDRAIFLTVGRRGRERLERALGAPPTRAPFYVLDGDYGRMEELRARFGRDKSGVHAANAKLYGRMRMTLDASERGLELRTTFETKPPPR